MNGRAWRWTMMTRSSLKIGNGLRAAFCTMHDCHAHGAAVTFARHSELFNA